jgi:hypothetical protein
MIRHTRLLAISLAAFTTLALLSCGKTAPDPRDIAAAETLWKTDGLSSYRIELEVTNGLTRHIEVTVKDGSFESGALLERSDGEGWEEPPLPLDETEGQPYTVSGLFQTLREEISTRQRTVSATFNPNKGYVERMELGQIDGSPPHVITVLSLEPL